MSNRAAKFVSAVFASILAGAPFTTVSQAAVPAADECLSGPKGQAPQGGHWYYRVDRATKRHCWYVGDKREKLAQIVPPDSSRSAKPASTLGTAMQPSISDARAELPVQARIEQQNDALASTMPADAAVKQNNIGATTTADAEAQGSLVASRWPDQSGAVLSPNPDPTKRDASASPNATTPSPSPLAAEQFAAADSSSGSTYSLSSQLVALIGALALAGIIGSAIFKFGRRPAPRKVGERRGGDWKSANADSWSSYPRADVPSRRTAFVRDLDQAGNERIAEFFSQLSKRTPT